jgi:lipopolysaccharide transport system permease protein
MMIYYSYSLTIKIIFLPLMIFLALVVTIATSLIFSALNVKYRDVRFVIMFLIQVWMYVTPIFYPIDIIPEGRRFIVSLNPMVGVVEGFRYCMLNTPFPTEAFYISVVYAIFMLIIGQYYFRYMEQSFADVV